MGSCTMAGVRIAHLPAFFEALHLLIPGIIHALKEDGGAKRIANFTNFNTCQAEILWAFRIIGAWGFMSGLSSMALIYQSSREKKDGFYSKVLRLFTVYQLGKTLLVMLVTKITGNGTSSVAPEAPGNVTPLISAFLHILTLLFL